MQPEERSLWEALTDCPGATDKLRLAAYYEREGRPGTAAALRYCAERQRWPKHYPPGTKWSHSDRWVWLAPAHRESTPGPHLLDRPILVLMPQFRPSAGIAWFDMAAEAIFALADALGWLKAGIATNA